MPTHLIRSGTTVLALAMMAAVPVAAQTSGSPRIAVIEVQRVITDSSTGKAALAPLEAFQTEQQTRLETMRNEVKDLRARLGEDRPSMSEEELERRAEEIETKTIALGRATEEAQREMSRRQEQILTGIEKKVMPVIQQVAEEGGYSLIFRKFESGLLFASEEMDVTDLVIQRLDG